MTKVCLFKNKRIIGFEVKGHSGFAQEGSDIVCAAISALTQTAVMGFEQVAKAQMTYRIQEGRLFCRLNDMESNIRAQAIMDATILGLEEIERQYPEHMRISKQEV